MKSGHDVFISYSSKDKVVANAVCHVLEQHGISCWIAPRDVQPGIPYAREIISGIENCQLMILIFTCHSNTSEHVASEIDEAFNNGKIIVPLLVDETPMNKEFKYYLGRKHWLVAYPDFEQKFGELVQSVSNILDRDVAAALSIKMKGQKQMVDTSISEVQPTTNTCLKIISNLSCRILVDFEEKAVIEADCLYKLPLALGEYFVQFISIDNSADVIEKEISLVHGDVLERLDLKTVKQEHQRKIELQKKMEWLPYIEGRKMGFKTKETEEIVIEAKYDFALPYSEGFACVKQNAKYGLIDQAGELIVSCIYDGTGYYSEGLAWVRQNGRYGFVDQVGKLIIPCIYKHAASFSEGLARVQQDGKYGFINQSGKIVIPCIYNRADSFSEGLACVRQNDKYGFIDRTGKLILPCFYVRATSFSEGLSHVYDGQKYYFIDTSGKLVFSHLSFCARRFHGGLSLIYTGSLPILRKNGFMDRSGRIVIPCIYDDACDFYGDIAFIKQDGKYGFIDKSGELVIPCVYDEANTFYKGLARVRQNGKYGFINQSGKLIIPCILGKAPDYFYNEECVTLNSKSGYIDYWGNFMEL